MREDKAPVSLGKASIIRCISPVDGMMGMGPLSASEEAFYFGREGVADPHLCGPPYYGGEVGKLFVHCAFLYTVSRRVLCSFRLWSASVP